MIFGSPQKAMPRQKADKCKIKVKQNRDGSYTKEIQGKCTREELEALSQIDASPRQTPNEY